MSKGAMIKNSAGGHKKKDNLRQLRSLISVRGYDPLGSAMLCPQVQSWDSRRCTEVATGTEALSAVTSLL
jgi:hypothetical protein